MKENNAIRTIKVSLVVVFVAAWLAVTPYCFGQVGSATCAADPELRKLDYWVGSWSASGSASSKVVSKVNLSLDNCMIVEHWDGGTGHVTEKMFAYSPDDKSWYGMFADNQGRAHVFLDGSVSSDKAEFKGPSRGPKGEEVLNKLTIARTSPNKVQETWEKSTDHGTTWTTVYRADYTRANP